MSFLILLLTVLFATVPAYAFSSFLLMDPGFQFWIAVKVPLASALCMGLLDSIIIYFIFQPSGKFLLLLRTLILSNLYSLFVSLIILLILIFFATNEIMETEYMLPIWFGMAYFAGLFIWFAWRKKVKLLKKHHNLSGKLHNTVLIITTLMGYGVLYWVVYLRLFQHALL